MALVRNSVKLISPASQTWAIKFLVASGAATSIPKGNPTESYSATGTTTGKVRIATTLKPTTADNYHFGGLSKTDSTDTAAADGVVWCYAPFPSLIYEAQPTDSTACNTQAKIDALMSKRAYFTVGSTSVTVLTSATDAAANGVCIVGGDYKKGSVWFVVQVAATIFTGTA